jgi:cytochrome c oxidase subunit 2
MPPRSDPRPGMPRRRRSILLAVTLLALVAAGCQASLYPPDPVTEQGRDIHALYNIVFLFAAAIFVAVEVALVYLVLRYRRRHDETLPEQTHGHTGAEVLWTLIPFVIVAFLFVISWQALGRVQADPGQAAGVRVKVTGFQWCWKFEYRDDAGATIATVEVPARNSAGQNCRDESGLPPMLVVPVGERIRLQLHSVDVIHAFYVPQFLSKLDVVPQGTNEARDNIFDFTPTQIGEFRGQCAEFCGLAHADMQFVVSVRSAADYQAWLTEMGNRPSPSAPGSPPPPGAALQLSASTAVSFEQNQLTAPAGVPFVIHFENKQAGVPHNVWIKDASGTDLFQGPDVQGGQAADYNVPASAAGTYTFYCHIHPNMTGTLEVR